MFSKKKRVGRELFGEVSARGASRHSPFFTIRVLRGPGTGESRYAVVVSKKVSKKAVTRNLLKRRTLAALRECPLPFPAAIVVFLKREAHDLPYEDLKRELGSLLSKLT